MAEEKTFSYWLPDEQGKAVVVETDGQSVIIIGANGSGKSMLGAWLEKRDFGRVHRINAQRNLNFEHNIPIKGYSEAEKRVFYGFNLDHQGNKATTTVLNDYNDVLAALIALKHKDNSEFVEQCKEADKNGRTRPKAPWTSLDKLQSVWDEVFPQRQIRLDDVKFLATLEKGENVHEYSATQMSDGERSVLYMAAKVLCVPKDKILIIDEPELHLHPSLMNRLWTNLEKLRPDCLFVYITHDIQFASSHDSTDKIWIREFDGQNWKLEKLEDNDLPEDLLLSILGNRDNVLFVEGEKGSYDSRLYAALYPRYYVIPCGGCTQVISRTKAFRNSQSLSHCEVYGIIDRDFRSDYELEQLSKEGVYALEVAEVENLFLVEELLRVMARHLARNVEETVQKVKEQIIDGQFKSHIDKQIYKSKIEQIQYKLRNIKFSDAGEDDPANILRDALDVIKYDEISAEEEARFRQPLENVNYAGVLKLFNEKSLSNSIGHLFGMQNKEFCRLVISLLNGEKRDEIVAAIAPYLPDEIPRD